MEKSIYQLICENINNGILDANFSLPAENKEKTSVDFAPGALDGICLFHMAQKRAEQVQFGQMAEAVECAASGNFPEADTLFAEWTKEHRAIRIVDQLQDYVIDHADHLDPGNILNAAIFLILHSSHIECVKIGLELLELFRISNRDSEEVREIVKRIGQYDEFTLFAVWNLRKWENGNQEIFELAKRVHGWGRIHAVEHLKPDTEEIRHWLLTEGTINNVANTYSALTCWYKSQAESILFGQPTPEEYKGITILIAGLLNEGPVHGISALKNAEQVLQRFLELSQKYELTDDDSKIIRHIQERLDGRDKTDS